MYQFGRTNFNVVMVTLVVATFYDLTHAMKPPPSVIVKKCCRIGEEMNGDRQCFAGASEKWWPHIHLLQKKSLFKPKGDAPRFFKVKEQELPACEHPEVFSGDNRMALFSNGSLFLVERGALIEPDHYCIDKDMAVVCFPQTHGADPLIAPTKVKKCCGLRSWVDDTHGVVNKCVALNESHDLYTMKLFNNSSNIDLVYGFPHCKIENHYAISGRFREDNLDFASGSFTLDSGRVIQSKEFCLEHTMNELNHAYVNVFTCADHFKTVPDTMAVPKEVIFAFCILCACISKFYCTILINYYKLKVINLIFQIEKHYTCFSRVFFFLFFAICFFCAGSHF